MENHTKEIEFIKERVCAQFVESRRMFTDVSLKVHEDFTKNNLLYHLDAFIAQRTTEVQTLTYYPPKQKFWDWLRWKKPKPFKVEIKANDVLKEPPVLEGHTIRMYETKIIK